MEKPGTVIKMKIDDVTSSDKFCPILASGSDEYGFECMKNKCEWWERWYQTPPDEKWVEGCTVRAIFEMLRKGKS